MVFLLLCFDFWRCDAKNQNKKHHFPCPPQAKKGF